MFGLIRKRISREDIPKEGRWVFDNYEDIVSKMKGKVDATVVTEAIFDKNTRELLEWHLNGSH